MGTNSADASASPLLKAHFRVADAWVRAILSNPATVVHGICGEKGGAGIEATYLIHPDYRGLPCPARFPKFESHEIRGQQNNLSDGRHPPHHHSELCRKSSLDKH